jgi:hypothetical protein
MGPTCQGNMCQGKKQSKKGDGVWQSKKFNFKLILNRGPGKVGDIWAKSCWREVVSHAAIQGRSLLQREQQDQLIIFVSMFYSASLI